MAGRYVSRLAEEKNPSEVLVGRCLELLDSRREAADEKQSTPLLLLAAFLRSNQTEQASIYQHLTADFCTSTFFPCLHTSQLQLLCFILADLILESPGSSLDLSLFTLLFCSQFGTAEPLPHVFAMISRGFKPFSLQIYSRHSRCRTYETQPSHPTPAWHKLKYDT